MHDLASPAPSETVYAVDFFLAFAAFQNILFRTGKHISSNLRVIPVNHRDFRILVPLPTSPLWLIFAERLITRAYFIQTLGINDKKILEKVFSSFISGSTTHPLWAAPFTELSQICWIDQKTERFFPKNDYITSLEGRKRFKDLQTAFPGIFQTMNLVAEDIDGFLSCTIP